MRMESENKSRASTFQSQTCILSTTSSPRGQVVPILAPETQDILTVWYDHCFWETSGRWEPRALHVPKFMLLQCLLWLLAHLSYSKKYWVPLGSRDVQSWNTRVCNSIFPAPDAFSYISAKVAKPKEYSTDPTPWLKAFHNSKGQSKDKCVTKSSVKIMRAKSKLWPSCRNANYNVLQ